jgi:ABC-2 type transport system permease protein
LWLGIRTIYHAPPFKIMILTLAWFLFAAPLSFTVGNLLSVYSPKRIDYSTFGRQRASETTILVSFAVQLSAIGMGALAIFMARLYGNFWIAAGTLTALAVPAIAGYFLLLGRIDRIAMQRREVLTTELCRT